MNLNSIAETTIDDLYGRLVDPNKFEEGYIRTGSMRGQRVEANNFGGSTSILKAT
jgi:hypothetical protein